MSANIIVSGSYVQDQRHGNVSQRFNPIQASAVGQAMLNHGFSIASLSTGRARHEDKRDFQRTLTRYRGPSIGEGVHLDLIYDSKHMGRGVDRILLGIYRMICTNGLFVGRNFFSHEIRHAGNTYDNLNHGIETALEYTAKLQGLIGAMQARILSDSERESLALSAVKLLTPDNAVQVRHRLLTVQRDADKSADLWTTYNVIQENAVKGNNVAYTLQSVDAFNRTNVRNMTGRAIKPNTGKDATFNQSLFDEAAKLVA